MPKGEHKALSNEYYVGEFPKLREWFDSPKLPTLEEQGYTVTNVAYQGPPLRISKMELLKAELDEAKRKELREKHKKDPKSYVIMMLDYIEELENELSFMPQGPEDL